jgi:hypothetical protein
MDNLTHKIGIIKNLPGICCDSMEHCNMDNYGRKDSSCVSSSNCRDSLQILGLEGCQRNVEYGGSYS